jgi:hypothetical protein
MEKKAPFHNGRNSFADAVLIELYRKITIGASTRSVFVTHNTKDFSAQGKDERQRWLGESEQVFRFDKWSTCRV